VGEIQEAAEMIEEIVAETAEELASSEHSEAHKKWVDQVALTSLLLGLIAVIGATFASRTAEDAIFERTSEIIEITRNDTRRLEVNLTLVEMHLLEAAGLEAPEGHTERLEHLEEQIREVESEAASEEVVIERNFAAHGVFSIGVALVSVSISFCGIALISTRRRLWHIGLVVGLVGTGYVVAGFVTMCAG